MRIYSATFTAGQTIQTENCSFLAILENTGGALESVDIKYFLATGETVGLDVIGAIAGYEATLPTDPNTGKPRLYYAEITSATAQTLKIGLSRGDGSGKLSRTVGSVDVLTLPDVASKTLRQQKLEDGKLFNTLLLTVPSAGQYSIMSWQNDTGSDIFLHEIELNFDVAQAARISIMQAMTQLATPYTTSVGGTSLKTDVADDTDAFLYRAESIASFPTGGIFKNRSMVANEYQVVPLDIILADGDFFNIYATSPSTIISGHLEWSKP